MVVPIGGYIPIYTSVERLQLELRGRLKIVESIGTSLCPEDSLQTTIAPELVNQKIQVVEDKIDRILEQIYCMPLQNVQMMVTEIVEEFVIAELMQARYFGTGMGNVSSDISEIGTRAENKANQDLITLTFGYNVYIPGAPPQQRDQFNRQGRRVELPGEVLRTDIETQKVPIHNETILQKSEKNTAESLFDYEFDRTNPFSECFNYRRNNVNW